MKKKVLSLFSVLFAILISMTGCLEECIEKEDRSNIIWALSEKGIIPENWEFINSQRDCDGFLPTGDAVGYEYIYKDENEKYYTIYMTDLEYESDGYYGDNEVFIEGGKTYFLITVSECDITETTDIINDNIYTFYDINKSDYYDSEKKYLLHYDNLLFVFQTDDLIVEEVIYEE